MSDRETVKAEREHAQVRAFLTRRGIAFQQLVRGSDPPDVIVHRESLPLLEIEVTEYHPESDRVGIEKRWIQLKNAIDCAFQERPRLKGISVMPIFSDPRLPQRRHHQSIAESLARCAEYITNRRLTGAKRLKVFFGDPMGGVLCWQTDPKRLVLSEKDWPMLAKHLSTFYIDAFPWDGHLPCNNPQAQTAWCSPYPAAFLEILDRKETRIRKALLAGKYSQGEGALLLLIVCNVPGDLASSIFGSENLEEVIREAGFDFEGSVFGEVWLMEAVSGASQRLHPSSAQSSVGCV